jgi:predicted transposase YbfD/YdcC
MAYQTPPENSDLVSLLADIDDPRREHGRLHKLEDVLTIALCTILCGHSEFTEMEFFGELREDWLRGFLELPNGIPSHDTFRNVFSVIKPSEFLGVFARWTRCVCRESGGGIVAFDGKALRGTKCVGGNVRTVVGAWAVDAGISLGQIEVDGKSNEITALPQLLEFLDLKGCIVTTDAMGCQKEVASKVIAAGANYVLALKGNQGNLFADGSEYLDGLISEGLEAYVTEDRARGRVEVRRVWAADMVGWMSGAELWEGLRSVAAVELECTRDGKTTKERRYFITSLPPDAEKIAPAVRGHWGIENSLHWVLDVVFGEDRARARTKNGAMNLSALRRLSQNLIKAEDQYSKWSVKKRKFAASQNPKYLEKLLGLNSDA